jgi:hypothetical protein
MVSGTFDVAVAGTIEVTVVTAGVSRAFTGSATGAATWGPVQVDFSTFGLPVGSHPATISAAMLGFVFPPSMTDPRTVTWDTRSAPMSEVRVDATLDGSPWAGTVDFGLRGASSLTGSAVPQEFADVPSGSYTLTVTGGGPASTSLAISTASTQVVAAGGTVTFSLSFTTLTHTITASVPSGHGTLTPTTQAVSHGSAASITITPDPGCHLSNLTDNGMPVQPLPAGNTWSIAAVTGDHLLEASFAPDVPVPDLGMHITSPVEGATLAGSMVAVSGTFDTARSGNFKLVVTIPGVGTGIYPFTVLSGATTWGPVSVLSADFPDLTSGETYGLTLQGTTDLPTIPPCQTGVRTVSWHVQDTVSSTLMLLPSWNVISVPFPTPVGLLPTCDLVLSWDGSLWQSVTTLLPGTGYLVRNTIGATTVPLTGLPSSSPQTQGATGTWQIIGNPYTTPASFACTSSVPYLLFWDGSLWQLASPTNLPPGLGFLLQASSPGTITLTRLP